MDQRQEKLAARFRELGADDPESWAHYEVTQNSPQLARFCFLRSLWPRMIDAWRDEPAWIDAYIAEARRAPWGAFSDAGQALQHMTAAGALPDDITSVARAVAYRVVFDLLYHLDYGAMEGFEDSTPNWRLVELDAEGNPTERGMEGLHEYILSMDPSGREGKPA